MLIWRITAIISLAVFAAIVVFLMIRKYKKNRYYHVYEEDECFKTTVDGGAKNFIYSTHGQTENYIKRYVLRKTAYDKSVICNYCAAYHRISFFVMCYNKKHKVINILTVHDKNVGQSSRIVNLPKGTKDVNIVIQRVEDVELNRAIIVPMRLTNIRLYSMWCALMFFTLIYSLRHLAIELLGSDHARLYLDSAWNWIGIAIIFFLAGLVYCFTVVSYRKKNAKNRNGGSTEYEFI